MQVSKFDALLCTSADVAQYARRHRGASPAAPARVAAGRPGDQAVMAAVEDLEGMNMIEIRQPIDVESLQSFLVSSVEDGARRFGGGRLSLKQFNNGASNPTYFISTSAGEHFVVRKKPPGKLLPGAHAVIGMCTSVELQECHAASDGAAKRALQALRESHEATRFKGKI